MPNLTKAAVTAWLTDARPTQGAEPSPPPIRAIEKEGPVPALLTELGEALDAAAEGAPSKLCSALCEKRLCDPLREVLAQLGAARTLRLITWLGEMDLPDGHEVVAALSQGRTPEARALRATLALLTRGYALRRMFTVDRLAALQKTTAVAFGVRA